jgi:hypothetical protein
MTKEKLSKVESLHSPEKKTATPTNDPSRPRSYGVYLTETDRHDLEEIAKKLNVNRHMLLSYAVRVFLANYRAGHIELDPTIEAGKVVLNVHIDLQDMDA